MTEREFMDTLQKIYEEGLAYYAVVQLLSDLGYTAGDTFTIMERYPGAEARHELHNIRQDSKYQAMSAPDRLVRICACYGVCGNDVPDYRQNAVEAHLQGNLDGMKWDLFKADVIDDVGEDPEEWVNVFCGEGDDDRDKLPDLGD